MTEQIAVRASLRDELSGPLRKVKSEVKAVGDEAKRTSGKGIGLHSTLGKLGGSAFSLGKRLGTSLVHGLKMAATAIVALAAVAVVSMFKLVKLAASAHETQTKFNKVFGAHASQVQAWVDVTNKAYGRSTKMLEDATARFGVFGKSAGIAAAKLPDFSTKLATAGLDLASFYNVDADKVFGALTAGLAGQVRPLRQFGIFLSGSAVDAQAKTMHLTGTLTDQQKVMVRQALILKQLGDAHGDLGRTSGSLANKMRSLKGRYEELKTNLGDALTPAVSNLANALDKKLSGAIDKVKKAAPAIGSALKAGHYTEAALRVDDLVGAHGRLALILMAVTKWGKRVADIVRIMRAAWQQGGLDQAIKALDTATGSSGKLAGAFGFVKQIAHDLWTVWTVDLAPAFKELGGSVLSVLLGGLTGTAAALHWVADDAKKLAPLFIVLVATYAAYNIAMTVGTLLTKAWAIGQGIATAATALFTGATEAATGAQVGLNAAVEVNPYVLAATVVVALGVGIWQLWKHCKTARPYILAVGAAFAVLMGPIGWIGLLVAGLVTAYKKSKTFRAAVDAVGRALKTAFLATVRAIVVVVQKWWHLTEPIRKIWLLIAKIELTLIRAAIAAIVLGAQWLWDHLGGVRGFFKDIGNFALGNLRSALSKTVGYARDVWNWMEPVRKILGAIGRWTGGIHAATFKKLIGWLQDALGWAERLLARINGPDGLIQGSVNAAAALNSTGIFATPVTIGGGKLVPKTGAGGGTAPGGHGDTRRPRFAAAGVAKNLARSHHTHRAADRSPAGTRHVTSAYRTHHLGSPDSDHRHGRAWDVVGANLGAYAATVHAAGGFAEMHGSGASSHLHAAIGDTARPMAYSGTGGGSTSIVVAPGAIVVTEPATTVDLEQAITNGIANYARERRERGNGGRRPA